jgi:hypothetical protein
MVDERSTRVHNGNGHGFGQGHGGKRWLLIGLLIFGGFWLVSDAYDDGYRDALIQTGQAGNVRMWRHGGPDFPWGLLIVGGIGYFAWRKGAFDRFNGPGGPFGNGQRGIQQYGAGNGPMQTQGGPNPGQGFGGGFRGPRAFFDEWHRQSHQEAQAQYPAPPAPPAPQAPTADAQYTQAQAGNGAPAPEMPRAQTPPPPPPAADYWTTMSHPAEPFANPGAPSAPEGQPGPSGATGPAPERW